MNRIISHGRKLETIEAKVKWFRSLTMAERMEIFCEFTDLCLAINPNIRKKIETKPIKGRIQVISNIRV